MSGAGAAGASNFVVIDLNSEDESTLIQQISNACQTTGFFQVTNHGISPDLISQFRSQCEQYFCSLDPDIKERYRRHENNARGYFDNELTKQRREWKQALDVGMPRSRDWNTTDDNPANACLDGYNQFPTESELPGFRRTVVDYFNACSRLSHTLATLMTDGILSQHEKVCVLIGSNEELDDTSKRLTTSSTLVEDLRLHHMSYLRLNYYPVCTSTTSGDDDNDDTQDGNAPPLGISPHRDAGFLTVLLPDEVCHSLQVWIPKSSNSIDQTNNADESDIGSWQTIVPIPGALTINTGDMAQIWSNGRYRAPLHRVLTHPHRRRFSAPFFYNPGYQTWIEPYVPQKITESLSLGSSNCDDTATSDESHVPWYHPCLWGYFRAVRFAGDLTNLGVEIQVEDYYANHDEKDIAGNPHWRKQAVFAETVSFNEPFSVTRFRPLLVDS